MSFLDGYEDVNARIKRARAEFPGLRLVAYIEDIDLKNGYILIRAEAYKNYEDDNIPLKGPNYNLSISDQINNSTQYASLSSLTATTSATGSGSLRYQLNSLLAESNVELNVDYSSYDNFIHFSSAQTRLENFYYKLALIEQYTYSASLSVNTATNYYVSSSNVIYQAKINEIITNFDGYEYYLYYESGKDIARACFESYDPDIYVNLDADNYIIDYDVIPLSFKVAYRPL